MLRYVMLCYVMLCYVMLCYVMLCYIILYYNNLMGPPSYMWSVVDRSVVMRRIPVFIQVNITTRPHMPGPLVVQQKVWCWLANKSHTVYLQNL